MKIPFVSFLPMEKELDDELHSAFDRVLSRSWYIEGVEDEAFEKAFAEYVGTDYCVGVGNGLLNDGNNAIRVLDCSADSVGSGDCIGGSIVMLVNGSLGKLTKQGKLLLISPHVDGVAKDSKFSGDVVG